RGGSGAWSAPPSFPRGALQVRGVGDRVHGRAADLTNRLRDAVHAVDVRLAELAAVRVERQAAADLDVPVLHEVFGLAARAEAELLELYQHEGREVVVEDRGADVARPEARHLRQLPGYDARLRQADDGAAGVAGHRVLVWAAALRGGGDERRRLPEIPGALGRHDDDRDGAVALLATVEQVQRLDDPARRLMVGERDRLAVEPRRGIGGGMPAGGD